MMTELSERAAAAGIAEMFVAADDEDTHALDFYRALGGTPSPVTHFDFASAKERALTETRPTWVSL